MQACDTKRFRIFSNKLKIILFYFVFLILSCGTKTEELPINEEKMVNIFMDVHVAEAVLQSLTMELKDSMAEVYYQQIYEIHQISKEDFEKTIHLLRENPLRLERLYSKVIAGLGKKEAKTK